jgi:dihydrofolate synthase/folylpolyglutamate synthase
LYEAAKKAGLSGENYSNVHLALEAAKKNASDNDLIFIGGSTFVVAEALGK